MITKKDIAKLESLLYLYAISKSKSKRNVAEQLGTTVDTINKYIADLEAEQKTKFLVSNGRGTVITPEGRRILKISENMVRAVHELESYAEAAESYAGVVRVATLDSIVDYIASDKIFAFMRKYSDLVVEMKVTNELPDMGTLETDICIDYQPPQNQDTVLIAAKKVRFGLFASQKYLDEFGTPKNLRDLCNNHRICIKEGKITATPVASNMLKNAKYVVYKTNSIRELRTVLTKGIGIGICSFSFGHEHLVHLKHLNFEFTKEIYLIAHKDTKDMPRIRLVLEYLKTLLDEKLGKSRG